MSTKMYCLVKVTRLSGRSYISALSEDPVKLFNHASEKYQKLTESSVKTTLKSSLGVKIFHDEATVTYIEETKIEVLK